jgi:hypothetical protein
MEPATNINSEREIEEAFMTWWTNNHPRSLGWNTKDEDLSREAWTEAAKRFSQIRRKLHGE